MKLGFRQGLVSYQKNGLNQPTFLLPSGTANFVAFDVSPTPTVANFAHGGTNVLVNFDVDVPAAWGPLTPGVTAYLYWDIDLLSGAVTRGITTLIPISQLEAPTSPSFDQHWFDLTTTKMKVWNGSKWQEKVRLFAGQVNNGNTSQIVPYTAGSQVGLNVECDAGYLVFDASNPSPLPVKLYPQGEFLTSATPVRMKTTAGTSGVVAAPPNTFIPVRASENIPKFSIVFFSGEDTVGLASSNPALPQPKTPVGIVQEDLDVNEVGTLTQVGEVSWDQWPFDLSAHIGKPVYCGENGEVTPVRPNTLMAYRVGFVKNATTIVFNVDAETLPQIYQADVNDIQINGVSPLTSTPAVVMGERIWTLEMPAATASAAGYATAAQITQLNTATSDIATINGILPTKADVNHTHIIGDVTGLQGALDALTASLATKTDRIVPASPGNFASLTVSGNLADSGYSSASFAPVSHTHIIAEITNLQTVLDGKSDVGHTHVIADTTGLQAALDGKAPLVHLHAISDVTGLQTALNNKSDVGHTHVMADISGLTAALSLKSDVGHTHVIAEVTGLQAALDSKAAIFHTHVIGDVTGLQTALDGKVSKAGDTMTGALTLSGDPVLPLQAATKQYVDANIFTIGSIDQHTDVDTTTAPPAVGDTLKWNGTNWVPGADNVGGTMSSFDVTNGLPGEGNRTFTVSNGGAVTFTNLEVDQTNGTVTLIPLHIKSVYNGTDIQKFPNDNASSVNHPMQLVIGSGLTATVTGTWNESLLLTAAGGVAQPAAQVVFGTDTGVSSDAFFLYDPISRAFLVNTDGGGFGTVQDDAADGDVLITTANNSSTTGAAHLRLTGSGGGVSNVELVAGRNDTATALPGGSVAITAGVSVNQNGGSISLTAGNSTNVVGPFDGGSINLTAGETLSSGVGGQVNITAGAGLASGGALSLAAGNGTGSPSDGGLVNIAAGSGYASGGGITLSAGAAAQTGGNVFIEGGQGQTQGGSVTLNAGINPTTPSSGGSVILQTDAAERLAITADGDWRVNGTSGTAGQVLTSNGVGSTPTWQDAAGGGGSGLRIQTYAFGMPSSSQFNGSSNSGWNINSIHNPPLPAFVDIDGTFPDRLVTLEGGVFRIRVNCTIGVTGETTILPDDLTAFGFELNTTGSVFGGNPTYHVRYSSSSPSGNMLELQGFAGFPLTNAATTFNWTDEFILQAGAGVTFAPILYIYNYVNTTTEFIATMVVTVEKISDDVGP